MMIDAEIETRARAVLDGCRRAGLRVATVESCTGGLVAGALTAIAGSSDTMLGGLVTYSNEAKHRLAAVPRLLIETYGAVSEPVARAMADGGRGAIGADLAVAITGIAGPAGGSATKPVGLVHFACAGPKGTRHREERFGDLGRTDIRLRSVLVALDMLAEAAGIQRAGTP